MDYDNQNNIPKSFFVVVGALALLIIAGLIALAVIKKDKSTVASVKSTLATSQTQAKPLVSSHPSYAGFDSLQAAGLSSDQLVALKYAFYKYFRTSGVSTSKVSIDGASVQSSHVTGAAKSEATFSVKIGSASFQAKVDYSAFGGIELYLSSSSGQKFDSGMIDINQLTPKYL